jgi:hypothetical protein
LSPRLSIAERKTIILAVFPVKLAGVAFINNLTFEMGCGSLSFDGWYAKLFYDTTSAVDLSSVIADVHTDPNRAQVLHVGTGMPRAMVVTIDTCAGPRAYVGLVSSYFEKTTTGYDRLTDERWRNAILKATPPDLPWMKDIVAR